VDPTIPARLYRVVGYHIAGNRAVRIDILERLADLIRPLIAWRPTPAAGEPPDGAIEGHGFTVTVAMTSLLGCSGDHFASVLRSLGYRVERRPLPKKQPELAASDAAAAEAPSPASAQDAVTGQPGAAPLETDAPATDASAALAEATGEAPAVPTYLEIWRPGRPARRPQRTDQPRHQKPASQKTEGVAGETAARPPRRPNRQRPQKDRRDEARPSAAMGSRNGGKADKPADPHSPFAALAALKAQLEAKQRGDDRQDER
jgi:ATP-dependent RNA helicase SUPV3L1/SUV3